MENKQIKCIVCGIIKDITEFFREKICIDCFLIADKFGRNRKVMKDIMNKISKGQ